MTTVLGIGIGSVRPTAASVSVTVLGNRLRRSPGWSPKMTTSAPSGARVRISTGLMSVR